MTVDGRGENRSDEPRHAKRRQRPLEHPAPQFESEADNAQDPQRMEER